MCIKTTFYDLFDCFVDVLSYLKQVFHLLCEKGVTSVEELQSIS